MRSAENLAVPGSEVAVHVAPEARRAAQLLLCAPLQLSLSLANTLAQLTYQLSWTLMDSLPQPLLRALDHVRFEATNVLSMFTSCCTSQAQLKINGRTCQCSLA